MIRLAAVEADGSVVLAVVEGGRLRLLRDRDGRPVSPDVVFSTGLEPADVLDRLTPTDDVGDLDRSLEPPVMKPSKIIGIGKNYEAHAREMKSITRVVYFMKAPSALVGHLHYIEVPPFVSKPDYEGEVVIVIGRPLKHVTLEQARQAIAGFMAGNDVTARDLQYDECMPWCLSKSVDTFSPVGPYLVLVDDYDQLNDVCVETRLNGERVQRGCPSEMTMSFAEIVSDLSRYMKLIPGDLIFTGTPPGVGHPRGRYLRDGDLVSVKVGDEVPLVNYVRRPGTQAPTY